MERRLGRPGFACDEEHELNLGREERQKLLYERVRESSMVSELSEDVKLVLDEFPEAFPCL